MKSILVVGGAGYIGGHVALEFLTAGFRVVILDNLSSGRRINVPEGAEFVYGDIHDRLFLRDLLAENFDAVAHLASLKAAGESMDEPEKYSYQNINGSLNLLDAVSQSKTRAVLFSSTATVYGEPHYLPFDEKHPVNPMNYYGFTKHSVEGFLEWRDRLKGVKYASLRYFNAAGYSPDGKVKGLEQNPANLIPVIMEVAAGLRESVFVFGDDYPTKDGTGVRDYVHVSDLAKAHLASFEYISKNNRSLTVNLGTGKGYSVMDIINMAEKVCRRKINYKIAPRRPGDLPEFYAEAKMAARLINWKPEFSDLETIVRTTWDVYKDFQKRA